MTLVRKIAVLGCTGSVGTSTLDLIEQGERSGRLAVKVTALAAGRNVERLAEQAKRWRPDLTVIADERLLPELRERLDGQGLQTAGGEAAVVEATVSGADWVMAAIVGVAGLRSTLAAAKAGAVVALANKESLVCMGPTLLAAAKAAGGAVIPVDSEHSAIFQVLDPRCAKRMARLILTASGGPFRTWSLERMAAATPAEAVAHPNWSMGAKISVDSATMMNKGLEMIEAAYLFDAAPDQVEVLVHPQSVIHSLVEYQDGSTLAQLGAPDMRTPIACALAWPDRLPWDAPRLDLAAVGSLTFEAPDLERFPALSLARQALSEGGAAPAILNAANEAAVEAFLAGRLGFLNIATVVADTLQQMSAGLGGSAGGGGSLEAALAIDLEARRVAQDAVGRHWALN
ncbi:MAG: 1-deoxy-D-xylulose-5-phosphate reductoisomerase [Pseudomonadota bacterium]|jgi:1-deoxy-D-xylulose-5-phosphate reductoisomerase